MKNLRSPSKGIIFGFHGIIWIYIYMKPDWSQEQNGQDEINYTIMYGLRAYITCTMENEMEVRTYYTLNPKP